MDIDTSNSKYFASKLIKWEKENFADFPWRHADNKWLSIVSEIMLQRTRAEQVLPAYNDFCCKYPQPIMYFQDESANIFESLGLQQRNKDLKKLAKILSENELPVDKQKLLLLPGVGEYIASAFRSLHLKQRDVIIDSNVVRLYGRFFGFDTHGETRRKKWFIELAETLTPKRNFYYYNYALLDFPRIICKTNPQCNKCTIKSQCLKHGVS